MRRMMLNRQKPAYSHVAISRGGEDLVAILRNNVDLLGGMGRFVKKGDTVFIKPNLTAGMPASSGGTTDVYFTQAVVELVKEAGAGRIIVGECSGNESRSIESLTNLGYKDMCERQGVEMVDLDFAQFVDVPVPDAIYKETLSLPRILMESDVFISVPVLKLHIGAGITVALKNSFGLVPDDTKLTAHRDQAIEEILADISSAKRPDLIFVDGRIGAEGIAGGTDFDHPIPANLILVADDPVAADAVSTRLMMQNTRVRHVQWAAEKGVGNDDMEYIIIHGLSIDEAKVRYMTPAEQIEADSRGKVCITELGPCTKCRAIGEGGVSRYSKNPNSLLEPVDIVMGPGEWDIPEKLNPRTVLLGDCIRQEYRDKGVFVGGCPVSPAEYSRVLAEYDIVCDKCAKKVTKIMEDYSSDDLSAIRVLASNKTVFKGENNNAMMDDYMLAVGDCQRGYCRNHTRRSHKISDVDISHYMELVTGCSPDEEAIRQGIDALLSRMKAAK